MKKLVRNLLYLVLVLGSIIFTSCTNEGIDRVGESIDESREAEFIVETDYEFHTVIKDWYKNDIVMPKVADSVIHGDIINERLKADYFPTSKEGWEDEVI